MALRRVNGLVHARFTAHRSVACRYFAGEPGDARAAMQRACGLHGEPVRMRLMGRPAVAIGGPEAARFFYESGNFERHDALPAPVAIFSISSA